MIYVYKKEYIYINILLVFLKTSSFTLGKVESVIKKYSCIARKFKRNINVFQSYN